MTSNRGGFRKRAGRKKGLESDKNIYAEGFKMFGLKLLRKDYEKLSNAISLQECSKSAWLKQLIFKNVDVKKQEGNVSELKSCMFFGMRFTKSEYTAINKKIKKTGLSKYKWLRKLIIENI